MTTEITLLDSKKDLGEQVEQSTGKLTWDTGLAALSTASLCILRHLWVGLLFWSSILRTIEFPMTFELKHCKLCKLKATKLR